MTDDISEKIRMLLSDPSTLGIIGGILGNAGASVPQKESDRINLLLAIKPFLDDEKKEKVDKIIPMLRILDMLEKK